MNRWTVELTSSAQRQYRQLVDGPKAEAKELLEYFEEEGPFGIGAIELRANPNIWRVRFHNDYRMIYRVSKAEKRIVLARIQPRSTAYKGMKQ